MGSCCSALTQTSGGAARRRESRRVSLVKTKDPLLDVAELSSSTTNPMRSGNYDPPNAPEIKPTSQEKAVQPQLSKPARTNSYVGANKAGPSSSSNSKSKRPSTTNSTPQSIQPPVPTRIPVKKYATLHVSECVESLTPMVDGKSLLHLHPNDIYLKGYVMKRGHTVKNWKNRYMVVDKTDIVYYVKDLPTAPFGSDMKGKVCLGAVLVLCCM